MDLFSMIAQYLLSSRALLRSHDSFLLDKQASDLGGYSLRHDKSMERHHSDKDQNMASIPKFKQFAKKNSRFFK
jgi:hypothetical protein